MRVAVVTDIRGNQRAFHAVLADLKDVAPDLIVLGGDLVFGGTRISSPISDSGQNTELLSPESHANPKLNIADIAAVSRIAQAAVLSPRWTIQESSSPRPFRFAKFRMALPFCQEVDLVVDPYLASVIAVTIVKRKMPFIAVSFLMIICRTHGQVNEPTANTRIWLASSVNGSHDSTLLSGELFRESLGVGLSKSLSHSWLFSPSVWYEAIETRQAAATSIESHFTVAWHHRFNTAWYLHAAPALEFASDSPYPYLKPRVEIGRKLFNSQGATPFVSWEAAYRADGGYLDAFRVRAGFRIFSRSGFEIVPMYDRRRAILGTGTMNGATLVLLYVIPRTRHCNPRRSNQDDSRGAR